MGISVCRWCVVALAILTNASAATAQSKLAWDEDAGSIVLGYTVTVDGVRTDYGLSPVGLMGLCGCSIPVPFSGGNHTLVVSAYNLWGEAKSASLSLGPRASAGGPYAGQQGVSLVVNGGGSTAPTGSITTYTWGWGDGTSVTSSSSPTASHTFPNAGTFNLTLTITDNAGATDSSSAVATITASGSPPPALPAPWVSTDVGSVGVPGSSSFGSGIFTVKGAGADIWGSADAFQYAYQPFGGDGEIVARVTSEQNTDVYAKAGVMIRDTLSANSSHVVLYSLPDGRIEVLARPSNGSLTSYIGGTTSTFPVWLKLIRSGSTVTAAVSQDGARWTAIATASPNLSASATTGLVVTSHNSSVLNRSTFDHVGVTVSTSLSPPPGNVVIYASDIPTGSLHGTWAFASDSRSPNGVKLATPNNGNSYTSAPLSFPSDYVDVAFSASAYTPYTLWLRLRALGNSKSNDSVWVQFSDAKTAGGPAYLVSTTSGLFVNLAIDNSGRSLSDWGWQNTAYSLFQETTITFTTTGTHTLRLQVREDGVEVDQIVLSPSTYIQTAPGPTNNDSTIVPKQ
jgi:hypothetical protein